MYISRLIIKWIPYPLLGFSISFFSAIVYFFSKSESKKYSLESGNIYLWKNHSDCYYLTHSQNLLLIALAALTAAGVIIGIACTVIVKLKRV